MLKHTHKIKVHLILAALLLLTITIGPFAYAQQSPEQNVDQLTAQKDEKRRQLLEIKAKISDLQKQINEQRTKIASLANEIKLFDLQIQQTQQQIEALNAEIEVINLEIIETLQQIAAALEKIKNKKRLLTELIREIYENDQTSPLEIVLAHNNFSEILNQMQNTIAFQNKNQRLLEELSSLKADLEAKQKALDEKKKELEEAKTQAEATKASLLSQQSQRTGLLSYTRGLESRYKQLLASVSEEESRVNREIFELDLTIRQKLGDKTLPVISEGQFSWPMEGILTQGYGETGFTRLGYSFHNGIDIAAPAGTAVRSAGDGVVFAKGSGRAAYGNWVVIKHTVQTQNNGIRNILTLYAHLDQIMVRTGQGVLQGDLVGLEGNTGNTTRLLYGPERGYHLHFSVFDEEGFGINNGAYTDIYGPYQIPFGYTYNPMDFLK